METVIVTGAGGFLGRACCVALTEAGFRVRALVRNPQSAVDLQSVATGGIFLADLPHSVDKRAFDGPVRALIHCAYATTARSAAAVRETNFDGTQLIVRLARSAGVRQLVFISSLASHAGAASQYGKNKWELEKLFTSPRDTIIRPGTIVGSGGVFERTRHMLAQLPVVPVLFADRELQTIHIDDACAAILQSVKLSASGLLILAHPQPIRMDQFYRSIAQAAGAKACLVPFPGNFALALTLTAERLGVRLPITSDNLLGIKHVRFFDPTDSLTRLEIQPMNFFESIAATMGRSVARNA